MTNLVSDAKFEEKTVYLPAQKYIFSGNYHFCRAECRNVTSRHAGVCLGTWITGTEGAVSLVALMTCKAFPCKISVECVPSFCFLFFWERSGILSYLPLLSLSIHRFLAPGTYTCCHVYVIIAAAAAFPTARSQERRHLLCPLCRSLAGCQTEPMPIKSHE